MSSENNYLNDKYKSFFEDSLSKVDPELHKAINDELIRQQQHIELIASENIVSQAVLEAQGSVLTNKYEEGYYFLPHIDMGGEYDPEKERIRTVIINLSTEDSFSGGDLYVGGDKIKYKQGKALSFYSSTVHEVTKITKGFRYSIALWLKKDNLKFYDPKKGPKPSLI